MSEQSHDDKVAEVLRQINPPPGGDLASVISRLYEICAQLQQIAVDVTVHGVVVGRGAVRLIGEYSMAWDRLADGVRRAAEQGGLIDARQLLDVMQELHDRFGLPSRPPNEPVSDQGERAKLT